jgi:hypothetical protein
MDDDVEAVVDELYGAALEDFVAERTRLAKQLRDAGNDGAAEFAKLRKPVLAAWTLNQLTRRNRRDVDLLLDAGHRLREAQAGALGGAAREEFDRARQTENDAVRRLTREAAQLLQERGGASTSVLDQVTTSLRSAAVSPSGRELLARGRFVEPLQSEGFDILGDLAGSLPPPSRRSQAEKDKKAKRREAIRAAKERLRESERRAHAAEQEAERLRLEAESARRHAADERAKADVAAKELRALDR